MSVASARDSLGQRLQREFPELRVVKALNSMNNQVMVRPQLIQGDTSPSSAATEMMMAIWMRVTLSRGAGAPRFNWAVLSADA